MERLAPQADSLGAPLGETAGSDLGLGLNYSSPFPLALTLISQKFNIIDDAFLDFDSCYS